MKPETLLVVEDNRQDEILIRRALDRIAPAYRVDVVRDGQQALDYLWRQGEFGDRAGELPRVVLLDLGLPRLGGLEVLARLRAEPRTRTLPVCVFTSSDDERDRSRSYENGANSYVRKPLDFGALAETVAHLATYWLNVNEPAAAEK